jgi:hypothetical protein
MRTFEYRLFPNRAQRQQLMTCLSESRIISNELLEGLKAQYETDGTFPTKYDLTACFRGRGGDFVPATMVQTLADRLGKARNRFLQLKDLGMPVASASRASRRPTAGTRVRYVSMRPAAMAGWTTTASTCMSPLSWAGCSR